MKRVLGLVILLAVTAMCIAEDAPGFKVTKRYPVPGDDGFDYIVFDSSADRLYVSHGTKVDVLDANSGKVIGKIENTPGVHGIAVVPDLHRGFITDGRNATVTVFDTKTLQTRRTIAVDEDPDFIFYDPQTRRVFVCHGDAGEISAIDPDKEQVAGRIPLGTGAEAAALDAKGNGYVNLEETAELVNFDPKSLSIKQKWPITGCKTPTGLAMDRENNRLFIGCRSKVLAVMDASSGKVLTTLPIGERVDAVAYDPDNKLIFASNGGGTVSVVRQKSADQYESVGDIQTQKTAKTMTMDPKTKNLYLSAAEMESMPAANGERARMRPKPGTFNVLVVERQ
jgi:DNA-binding beta-propeller fold protein YncE